MSKVRKLIDPMLAVALVLVFAVGLIVGQQTAGDVAVATSNPYKALTLDDMWIMYCIALAPVQIVQVLCMDNLIYPKTLTTTGVIYDHLYKTNYR